MKHLKLRLRCLGMVTLGLLLTACSVNVDQTIDPAPTAATTAALTDAPQVTASIKPDESDTADVEAMAMVEKTRYFILVGQKDRPEAGQYHWTEEFLNLLDLKSLYAYYILAGGEAGDVEEFTAYITENAPVPENWKEMFEAAFAEAYGLEIVEYELIQGTLYEVHVKLDGDVVPYVGVDSRTGYYHG